MKAAANKVDRLETFIYGRRCRFPKYEPILRLVLGVNTYHLKTKSVCKTRSTKEILTIYKRNDEDEILKDKERKIIYKK